MTRGCVVVIQWLDRVGTHSTVCKDRPEDPSGLARTLYRDLRFVESDFIYTPPDTSRLGISPGRVSTGQPSIEIHLRVFVLSTLSHTVQPSTVSSRQTYRSKNPPSFMP